MKSDILRLKNAEELVPPGNIFMNKKYRGFFFGIILRDVPLRRHPTFKKNFSKEGFDLNCEALCRTCEPIIILDILPKHGFCFVKTRNSHGFVPVSYMSIIGKKYAFNFFNDNNMLYITEKFVLTLPSENKEISMVSLSFGSKIPYVKKSGTTITVLLPKKLKTGRVIWQKALLDYSFGVSFYPIPFTPTNLIKLCKNMLGMPYDWGESFGGCDCSSLISSALFLCGKYFPRNTRDMFYLEGVSVESDNIIKALSRCKKGDILLCHGHVMLYIGKIKGEPYVIHSFYKEKQVAITPLNTPSSNGVPLINLIKKIVPLEIIEKDFPGI